MKLKLTTFLIALICVFQTTQAQSSKSNFVRLDPLRFLSALAVNIGYEYSATPTIGVGAEAMFNTRNRSWVGKNNVGVFGRFYLDNTASEAISGPFAEVYTRVSSWDETQTNSAGEDYSKGVTAMSLGFGGGYKYMFSNGFGIDLVGGIGRFLSNSDTKLDWKLAVSVGWAF